MQGGELVTNYWSTTLAIENKVSIHGERLDDVTVIGYHWCDLCPYFEGKYTNLQSVGQL